MQKKLAFFTALCMFLSVAECAIPKPVPFLRIGLANVPIILAFEKMRFRHVALLALLKVTAQGIAGGTLFSYIFIFSAAGTFASATAMFAAYQLLFRQKAISYIGMSVAGAAANNAAQLALSYALLFGQNTRFVAPVLLICSAASAPLLGAFANAFSAQSQWYAALSTED